jgi:hypothetical protein
MKDFQQLLSTIEQVHQNLQASAANAVNKALTLRNWLIGFYIVEFEQNGEDRAKYGGRIITDLAKGLKHIKGLDDRGLRKFRQFYPQIANLIWGSLSAELNLLPKWGTVSPESRIVDELNLKVGTTSPQLEKKLQVPPDKLVTKLSYSHLELMLNINDPLKRTFYELECIKGTWSVRELKRQINSLYFERSGLSQHPEKLAEMVLGHIISCRKRSRISKICDCRDG